MLEVVIIFLLVSIYLYCLLGGADFGAGILEFTSSKKTKQDTQDLVTKAMAPIWEANHMWLIITVVILFMGFPTIYTQISTSLSIPLVLLLVGIVLRGTAFTFRHYDAIKDDSQIVYSRVFAISSVMVSFFFGLIVGAIISGKIPQNPTTFPESYIFPWLNLFSISVGLFICSLFAFIAAVFLISETTKPAIRSIFISKSKKANIASVITGLMVFGFAIFDNIDFTERFFSNPVSIVLIILATASLPLLWKIIEKGLVWPSRMLVAAQLLFIIGAFYSVYFPVVIRFNDGNEATLLNSAAPEVTLQVLGWALVIGSFFIFPALFYLFKVFKLQDEPEDAKEI
jgi:cytochrome bd ubiquinol oxidase subunit II